MRALRDMNLPKFVFEDVPLFLGLIADLFPGLDCPRVRYPNFNDAVEAVLQENKYVLLPHQVCTCMCYYFNICIYYINTNEIPSELSPENMISSHVKITYNFHT